MEDQYKKYFEDINKYFENLNSELNKAHKQIYDVIIWLAEHTLTASEYREFIDKFFTEKTGE